jgi:hypothetical protein
MAAKGREQTQRASAAIDTKGGNRTFAARSTKVCSSENPTYVMMAQTKAFGFAVFLSLS